MAGHFKPANLQIERQDGGQYYDEDVDYARAQLHTTLTELMRIRPDAAFVQSDLVGYFQVQYGVDSLVVKRAINEALNEQAPQRDPASRSLARVLPGVLDPYKTEHAVTEKISVSADQAGALVKMFRYPGGDQLFQIELEKHAWLGDALNIYPVQPNGLEYKARASQNLGWLAVGGSAQNITVHTDLLSLKAQDQAHDIMVISRESTAEPFPLVSEVRLVLGTEAHVVERHGDGLDDIK